MFKGYDVFYKTPGVVDEIHCRVCHTKCEVERNVRATGSWIEAMGKSYNYYDVFTCPHTGKEWHEQALRLVRAIEETPGKRVASLLRLDLEDLLSQAGINGN
ncbi:MAG: hypothetical protein ACE5GL_03790 [Calditrichia bacterium]